MISWHSSLPYSSVNSKPRIFPNNIFIFQPLFPAEFLQPHWSHKKFLCFIMQANSDRRDFETNVFQICLQCLEMLWVLQKLAADPAGIFIQVPPYYIKHKKKLGHLLLWNTCTHVGISLGVTHIYSQEGFGSWVENTADCYLKIIFGKS